MHLLPRSWFLKSFSNEKKPGLLGEMADTGPGIYKVNLEHLMVVGQGVVQRGTAMEACQRDKEPTEEAPNGRAGIVESTE